MSSALACNSKELFKEKLPPFGFKWRASCNFRDGVRVKGHILACMEDSRPLVCLLCSAVLYTEPLFIDIDVSLDIRLFFKPPLQGRALPGISRSGVCQTPLWFCYGIPLWLSYYHRRMTPAFSRVFTPIQITS